VVRVADRLDLDHSTVTAALTDAATAGHTAPGRAAGRELRDDLDRGQGTDGQRSAAALSAAGYPRPAASASGHPGRTVYTEPPSRSGLASRGAGDPQPPPRRAPRSTVGGPA
jgi:hypothetical protein